MITLHFNLMPNFKLDISVDEKICLKDLKQLLINKIREKQPELLENYGEQLTIYCARELNDDEIVKNVDWSRSLYSTITIRRVQNVDLLEEQETEIENNAGSDTSSSEDELDSEELEEDCRQLVEEFETIISTQIETYQRLLIWAGNNDLTINEFAKKLQERKQNHRPT
jgi:arsenate reductase-like glutaredoxin family protein